MGEKRNCPPSSSGQGLARKDKPGEAVFVNLTGGFFTVGTIGGFFYHLVKNRHHQIQTCFNMALTKAPRVGGFMSLLFISESLAHVSTSVIRGFPETDNYLIDCMACPAFTAALMWSPRGLRSASRAALIGAFLPPLVVGSELYFQRRADLKQHHQSLQQPNQWLQRYRRRRQLLRQKLEQQRQQ